MNRTDSVSDIVFIDDDVMIVVLASRYLKNSTYSYRCFSDLGEARRFLDKNSPKVVVVDYRMPRSDGLAFIKSVYSDSNFGGTVIYLCSSSELPQSVQRKARELGVASILKEQLIDKGFIESLCE